MLDMNDESYTRAEMVLDGTHPTINYADVVSYFGLDTSFVYTPLLFAPYTDAFLAVLEEGE